MRLRIPPIKTVTVAILLFVVSNHPAPAVAPYQASTYITGVHFDWSTHVRRASGSDNWPITWADDDHQYTAWGDGWGFAESGTKRSLGVSRIVGSKNSYSGQDLWYGDGKSYGILCVEGILHMWVGPGSGTTSYDEARLYSSTDHGTSWTPASWAFTKSSGLVMPSFINYGKNYAGARDGYIYACFIRLVGNPSSLGVMIPGKIDLARVPQDQILNQAAWEFFAGFGSKQQPTWTNDVSARSAIFEDPNGVGWNASISYNPGLGRYLLCTEHSATIQGRLGIFDAPTPWGPWSTVYYAEGTDVFGAGHIQTTTFFWNFSNKWLSADGRDFVLVFTGTDENDTWNTVEGHFDFPAPYPASQIITGITFNWGTHKQYAPGSDNWPITWADDDHQYTAWGDGGGFGGTNDLGRVSNGFARLQGDKDTYTGCNVAGGVHSPGSCPSPAGAPFTGKCHGLVSIGGILYAWRDGDGSGESAYEFTELWKSTDHGATWSNTGVYFDSDGPEFPDDDNGFFCTIFLQFGKDYSGLPAQLSGYFYIYATNVKRAAGDWEVQYPGEIILIRVPIGQVENKSAYEYFAGLSGNTPVWTTDKLARVPVWRDEVNGVHRITINYNAPLQRYFLWTEHTARNSGNTAIYEAASPWGPWYAVLFDDDFAAEITSDKGVIFLSFSNKWLSGDGLDFVSVMSVDDAFDTVEGNYVYSGDMTGDDDSDGIVDIYDNCPHIANPDQTDSDGDGVGNVCEADFDDDGDVDQEDFGFFQACYTGPSGTIEPGCGPADLDNDTDVDLQDFIQFRSCISGENKPPDC